MQWRCEDCFYGHFTYYRNEDKGRCRFNPPTPQGFPEIRVNDWCGKFTRDVDTKESEE